MNFFNALIHNTVFMSAVTGWFAAQVINEMMEFWEKMGQPISYEEKLKEFVGHTPLQVFVGALLGILIAVLYGLFLG